MSMKDEEGTWMVSWKIWIRKEVTTLKLRIAVAGHCGEREHRTYAATLDTTSGSY